MHSLAEHVLRAVQKHWPTDFTRCLEDFIGTTQMEQGFEIEITEDKVDAVYTYTDYVLEVWGQTNYSPMILETKVEIPEINFGSPDCVMVVPFDTVHVFDAKFGQGKRVSAWENKQLLTYALAYMLKEDCTKFVLHICQPRVEDGFTTFSGTLEDITAFHVELKEKAAAAIAPNAPLIPGDWCKSTFCPNRVSCKALNKLAHDVIVSDFSDPMPVDQLSLQQILNVLKYEDTIKDWMSKVGEVAKEMMLRGEEVPGYKVVQSLGHAKWIDEDVIKAEFEDEYGDKIYKPKELVSPTQLEKVIGKKNLGATFREDYTYRPMSGYRIVPEDAKGDRVTLNAPQNDFND